MNSHKVRLNKRFSAGRQKQVVGGCLSTTAVINSYHPPGVYDNRSTNHLLPKMSLGDQRILPEIASEADLPVVLRSHDPNAPIILTANLTTARADYDLSTADNMEPLNRPWLLNLGSPAKMNFF